MILASGDSGCGYELFMRNGYVYFTYVYTRDTVYSVKTQQRLPKGEHQLSLKIDKTGAHSAQAVLLLSSEKESLDQPSKLATLELPKMWPIYTPNSGVRCGENRHAPISRLYSQPFAFDQTIKRAIVDIDLP